MKNELKRVYEIIPPDSLHQIEGEEHRTLLSEEEVEFVVAAKNVVSGSSIIIVVAELSSTSSFILSKTSTFEPHFSSISSTLNG